MSGSNLGSSPAGLCWPLAHLVQCETDEPSWTRTQAWVQARTPLNWTKMSSVIQWPPTRRWPNQEAEAIEFISLPSLVVNRIKQDLFQAVAASIAVWMHHLDTNETHEEKVKRELRKNSACCFKQNLEATKQLLYGQLTPISKNI